MTDADEDLSVWISALGLTIDQVEDAVASVSANGIPSERIWVLEGDVALPRDVGAQVTKGDAASLNRLLGDTLSPVILLLRRGRFEPGGIEKVRTFLAENPSIDVLYGDSVSPEGHPLFRPLFSPLRLRSNDFLGPVLAVRSEALLSIEGFRPEAAHAHVLDVALRLNDAGRRVSLLPWVVAQEHLAYTDFSGTVEAQRGVVDRYLSGKEVEASIEEVEPFVRRIRYAVAGDPLVSIVIPTRGGSAHIAGRERVLVVEAVRGIVERSTYRSFEIVVVADRETSRAVIEELESIAGDRLRLVAWTEAFNFSAKMNRGALLAQGEFLLLLNDDVEVVTDDWLETMVGLAQQDNVGIVGAMLYFEDSTLQHAGQVYTGGVAGHAAFGWPGGRDDSIKSLKVDHEVSGVTAACALVRRELFLEVGGFTLALPGNYNDVDLNMKIRASGRTAVFSPWVRLYHFESKSRDPRILDSDLATLQSRWQGRMQVEMYSRML